MTLKLFTTYQKLHNRNAIRKVFVADNIDPLDLNQFTTVNQLFTNIQLY